MGASIRIFPCGCQLPIHDTCVEFWKRRGGLCPVCAALWSPASSMNHRLVSPPLLSDACKIRCCTAMVILLVLIVLAMVLYYLIALRS